MFGWRSAGYLQYMRNPQVRTARRAVALIAVAGSLFVAGCSDDADPDTTVPGTLDDGELNEAPGVSSEGINDVTNGAGEGGNAGDTRTGTAAPSSGTVAP